MGLVIKFALRVSESKHDYNSLFFSLFYDERHLGTTKTSRSVVGFEVLTALAMKNAVFLVVTLFISETARRFGGTYRLYLQSGGVSRTINQQKQAAAYFSTLTMEAIWFSDTPCPLRTTGRHNP
jgi:hypothetical protein